MGTVVMSQVVMEARFQELVRQRDIALADVVFKAGRIAELEQQIKILSESPSPTTTAKTCQ